MKQRNARHHRRHLRRAAGAARSFHYQQGQHLTLRTQINGEDVRRSYSICSAVQDGALRVAIKRTPGGAVLDLGQRHPEARHDDRRDAADGPLQRAARRRQRASHYLAFAAGSGITPILSIIKTTLLTEPHSSFTLFYGNRASSSA